MKTPMQEAIEYLRAYNLLSAAAILEDKFLEKEEKHIVIAYNACAKNIQDSKGQDYYNKTYKPHERRN